MITKFKLYEAVNTAEPEVGDYVIADSKDAYDRVKKIFNTTIGQITNIHNNHGFIDSYVVIYDDFLYMPVLLHDKIDVYDWWFNPEEIECWSKNKEELEEILATKKYNL